MFRRYLILAALALWTTCSIAAPCVGFSDVEDTSSFCANVAWIKNRGITVGCNASAYCPNEAVSRLAMAAFLSRFDRVLPPTVVGPTGIALGSFVAGSSYFVHRRVNGELYELPLDRVSLGKLELRRAPLFFELPGCNQSGKTYIHAFQGTQILRVHAKVVRGADDELRVYGTAPFAPFGTVATASLLDDGVCLNIPYAMTLVEATLVEDLGYVHTDLFEIR